MTGIIAWLGTLDWTQWAVIAGVIWAILTKKIDISSLLNIFKPNPTPDPNPNPTPGPLPLDLPAILQLLMSLLLKAKASGDKETEASVQKILSSIDAPMASSLLSEAKK